MSAQYTVGNYLIDRLKEIGVEHIFGVPGDFGFPFMDLVVVDPGMTWVGSCNELNAAYSADGYARMRGMAAICGSGGVLEMGAAGGIAGAFAEEVPMLVIAGAPSQDEVAKGIVMHHSLRGRFDQYAQMLAPVTAAQVVVTADDACAQIDQAIQDCWAAKAPVHLRFPRDVQVLPADRPASSLSLATPESDPAQLDQVVENAVSMLRSAQQPAILTDYMVDRYRLTDAVQELSDTAGIPLATTLPGRSSAIDQTRPGYIGCYAGSNHPGDPAKIVDGSDALIRVCLRPADTNEGSASPRLAQPRLIDLQAETATINGTTYAPVAAKDVLERLSSELPTAAAPAAKPVPATGFTARPDTRITQDRLWEAFTGFVAADDVLAVDYGTCQIVSILTFPVRTSGLLQATWDAIGWTTPAVLGAQLAQPSRRFVQVVGDGGFQETAQEVSTTIRYGLAPITILINNSRYEVENVTHQPPATEDYNTVHPWDYAQLPAVLGPEGKSFSARVSTEQELVSALAGAAAAQREGRYSLIDIIIDPDDVATAFLEFMDVRKAAA